MYKSRMRLEREAADREKSRDYIKALFASFVFVPVIIVTVTLYAIVTAAIIPN